MKTETMIFLSVIYLGVLLFGLEWITQTPYEVKTSAGTKMMIIPPGWSGHYILDGDNKLYVNPTDLEG